MSLHRGTIAIAGTEVQTGHWIGGERVESADTFSDFSPIDGTPLAEVAAGGTLRRNAPGCETLCSVHSP